MVGKPENRLWLVLAHELTLRIHLEPIQMFGLGSELGMVGEPKLWLVLGLAGITQLEFELAGGPG